MEFIAILILDVILFTVKTAVVAAAAWFVLSHID